MTASRGDMRAGRSRRHGLTRRNLIKAGGVLLAVRCAGETPPTTASTSPGAVSTGKVTALIGNFGAERFDLAFTGSGQDYLRLIHGWLIEVELKEGRQVVVPGIASEWRLSEDGLTWTFTIRRGVKFHDGTDVTAADVLWSLRHVHLLDTYSKPFAVGVARIEQTGPDKVSVTTKVPTPDLALQLSQAGQNIVGAVYPKRATLHDDKEEAAYDRNPIGAGIMKMVQHVQGVSMTFERFSDYYYQPNNGFPSDKRVNFSQLELRVVPEEATRVAALRTGEADIAPVSLGTRKQVEAGGGRLVFAPEAAFGFISQFGCWKPQFPCTDKRVRQALSYAIDKELIRTRLYGADVMNIAGWCWVTPSTIGYSKDLDPYPFDPVTARRLLADAGYPGGKGLGQVVINTWVAKAIPSLPEMAQVVANSWKRELGLDVVVRVGDEAVIRNGFQTTEDYYGQMLLSDNNTRINAISITRSFYGDRTRAARRHDNAELFALVQQAVAVVDPVKQEKALTSLYKRLRDEDYEIPLGYFNLPWGVGPRIRTWEPYPVTDYPSALHTLTLQ